MTISNNVFASVMSGKNGNWAAVVDIEHSRKILLFELEVQRSQINLNIAVLRARQINRYNGQIIPCSMQ